ncbi:hypothetical protein QTP70_031483 [Hemibagrus guttatus]|uniref:Endonuclease/exonuclease/phosphatase domain-containing protein n=1 Tax=Hemibagrus guttatus TaxID=175788 RepID=A0AAE0UVM1_9TELE|nr:hypothetical protein QTP70_031483 [Hemibagrus guttatus]
MGAEGAERKWKKSQLDTKLISYRVLLSKFSLDVTSAKTSFYKEKLEASAQDPQKLHNIFLSLLNPLAPPAPSCRAGVLARLQKQPLRPPLPSLFLTNSRSLTNKMDELRLQTVTSNIIKDSCILLITVTWLHSSIPDSAIELTDYTAQCHDRTSDSNKSRGGGLCMYVKNNWCTNTVTVDSHCSPKLEYVTVKRRPIYLPREFTVIMITAVYIPPDANANLAIGHLHASICSQQCTYPDAVHIIAGDFNHADLKAVLPKFYQHVKCATRGANTLDKVYSTIKLGYRARPLPHLGQSDHMSLLLIPAYAPSGKLLLPSLRLSRFGQMVPLSSCRTASTGHTVTFFNIQTWRCSQTVSQ